MTLVPIPNSGSIGVNKDLSSHELPDAAWTDANNIRFLDGMARQFYGHIEVYNSPTAVPQHILACTIAGVRYWVYATATKCFTVTISGGVVTSTDITHATPRAGIVNQWTSTLLSGVPIMNTGDTTSIPMSWDLNTAHKFIDLVNWPASTYCKSLRAFKNYLVALNVTKSGTNYPFMVKWSHPADPGSLPSSWDQTDATKDAGELDLAEGGDIIIDGLQLRDSFMIYKESSIWRMDYIGGPFVFRFQKVLGTSGALNKNCIVEADGIHVVLTGSDVIVHDGQNSDSILDKQTRRYLFDTIDSTNIGLCFMFKNIFFNEVFLCYPQSGSSVCDKALVWNYKDKTVSFRDLPNLNHAAYGAVDASLSTTWDSDSAPWDSDITLWSSGELVPSIARVLMASQDMKLYLLDSGSTFNGVQPASFLERIGLSFGAPEGRKLVKGIRPRIQGVTGQTVNIKVGSAPNAYDTPTYAPAVVHTIGTTVRSDVLVDGRYIAIRIESGTAYQWRLDSMDVELEPSGVW
jgi:hypothetical protein